ncbi:MAG: hypothetical protein FWG98_04720 [Candidatus Cloacimonetes bacterium]|nr:hypothetical protein [Candidatus Cloacimonadota bacterium]
MRFYFLILCVFLWIHCLFSAIIISRSEAGIESKELYHENIFAEIHNDRIVSIWDFNSFELTLIHHPLRIYTTVDYETFKNYSQRQNEAQITSDIRAFDDERRQLVADATNTLFRNMRAHFTTIDTLNIFGYKAYEFHVFNRDVVIQKIWISRDLQERIDREINPLNIKQIEQIFKGNRERYFEALGIQLDPVSQLVEMLEDSGYVVKRVDYGLRDTQNPEYEQEIESIENIITDIQISEIDPEIFTFHQRYRNMDYNDYQMTVIRFVERQLADEGFFE